jgi:hypothetical protein
MRRLGAPPAGLEARITACTPVAPGMSPVTDSLPG